MVYAIVCEYQENCLGNGTSPCEELSLALHQLPFNESADSISPVRNIRLIQGLFTQIGESVSLPKGKDILAILGFKEYFAKNCSMGEITMECIALRAIVYLFNLLP